MSWDVSKPRIACVASSAAAARTAQADLAARYGAGYGMWLLTGLHRR
jgi:hypothetical protein